MDVLDLLDQLDDLIYNARPAWLHGQARVDRDEVYALLDQIRVSLPEEIKQAEWIVKERRQLQREQPRNERLRAAIESIDEVAPRRPAPPPLTPAAAERVCGLIEHAERLRADAERQAGEMRAEAERRADPIVAEAQSKLRRAEEVVDALMREASLASAEIDGLLDCVRGPAAALGDVLEERATALGASIERVRTAMGQPRAAAAEARETHAAEDAVEQAASEPEGPVESVVSQPTEEWSYPEGMAAETVAHEEPDPGLPGPGSHVHAERLADQEEPAVREGRAGR